jgi:putative Holliday junction resolvase
VGLDFGEKRFGISLSDPLLLSAQSHGFIPARMPALLELLKNFNEKYGEITLVVGMPITLRGKISQTTQKVIDFIEILRREITRRGLKIMVENFDERFSTKAAERTLIEAGISRQERKQVRDGMAAAFMLQGYLEKLKTKSPKLKIK